jgi:A/G-specific adenine glycosylase
MVGSPATFARRLLRWYDKSRRDLPWRPDPATGRPQVNPYHVLVSEAMLQQTQVATVIPYFNRFIARLPTLADLAAADEQEVLRLWQGLGYYSRARNLQAAARRVVSEHGGQLPREVDQLLKLPGVGRYTAGAVASIAFGRRAPILDGNVLRVLCRVDKIMSDPRDRDTQALLWRRAEEILPKSQVGEFNSALMELGATVCIPRSPQCLICPVREHCEVLAAGVQERIPPAKKSKPTPLLERSIYCIRSNGRWLLEQRPATGRWASMWQFVTRATGIAPGEALPVRVKRAARIGEVTHSLTHRRYRFDVHVCDACGETAANGDRPRQWVTLEGLSDYPLPRPHLKVAQMLRGLPGHYGS